jgi:hypothetical protein
VGNPRLLKLGLQALICSITRERRGLLCQSYARGGDMTAVKTSSGPHPLCFEHHLEMNLVGMDSKRSISGLVYACPKADCPIHFNSPVGYYVSSSTPSTHCPHHGVPMYLAEVQPRKRSFRLWRCPLSGCKASLTNEAHLVAAKYQRRFLKVSAPRTRGKRMTRA